MKYLYLLCFCILLGSCAEKSGYSTVDQRIEQLRSEYAPDKRVAIWNIATEQKGEKMILKGETQFPEAKTKLFTLLDSLNIAFVDSVVILPDANLEGMHFGVVRLPVANIRSNPKHIAELSTQATLGTPLRILKKQQDWYLVQTPDHYLGFLDAAGFTPMTVNQYQNWQQSAKIMITKNHCLVYEKPDASSGIISYAVVGNILENKGNRVGSFVGVAFPDGRTGYVNISNIESFDRWLDRQSFSDTSIISTALSFMGTPYLWGGTSPNGFDCSGFTKTVFYLNGLLLPRDASQQVHVGTDLGTELNIDNWKRGDLLFFGQKESGDKKEKITHVGIYFGDGKIIHSAGNVKIESLIRTDPDFAPGRYDTFVRAKRILRVKGDHGVYAISDMAEYGG